MRLRLPIAIVAALVVAEAAVLLMRPRGLIEPLDVAPRAYFSAAQIEKAEAVPQRPAVAARAPASAIELGVLALVVARPPRALLRPRRRKVLAGAAAAAALSVALSVATLPVRAIARERAKDVGLVTQDWAGYAGDVAKSTAIGAVLAGAGGALLIFGMRRFGRRWWAPAAAVVIGFGVVTTYLTPIVLDPLFNKFTPLPAGPTRSTVLALAREAGVDVGQVYVMDASRRTTAANAYVTGIGRTKRVVLYDNLLKDFTPDEVRLVVAHELGHVHYRDVPHGLLYLALVAPFGMFAAARLGERLAPRDSLGHRGRRARGRARGRADRRRRSRRSPTSSRAASSSARTSSRSSSTRRAGGLHRLPAADRGQERLRPGPAGRGPRSCSARTRRRSSGSAWRGASSPRTRPGSPLAGGPDLGEVLDPLGRAPLGPVVLHRVDQLAEEARREVHARDDDAGHLALLDLVVDARERDR